MKIVRQSGSQRTKMSQSQVRKFDLNIEKILEGWELRHAIREVLANALDEQALTSSAEIRINKDSKGVWHVRDYGRGLRYDHLTQNENKEKLRYESKVVGKFGVGLKDALATLHRRGTSVVIKSKHGDIELEVTSKHGFSDVATLRAVIHLFFYPNQIVTDVSFKGISHDDRTPANIYCIR